MISNNLLKKPFSLQDWKESIYSTSTNYRTVYSPQNYDLESPNTSDLVVNPAFDRYSDITVKTKTGILVEIPNGASQISFNASLCLSEKGKVIEEVSTGSYGFLYFSQPLRLKEYREVDGIVAMCAIRQNWGSAYYHWIIEVLPYFLILKARHKIWNEIDYFYLNSLDCDFQKESLRAFGLDSSKVIESKKDPKIKAKKMYVPFEVYGDMKMPSPEILSKLKNVFLNAEQTQVNSKHPKNWQRIYISRSQAKHRKLVNEDILITFLKSQNFTIVNLENMSVSEQANIINSSQVIVAPHGAGLTNIVFANPGTTVIEIFSPNYINCCYWLVAQAMQLKYWYFVGNVVNKPHQAQVRNECLEDISIDIERFKLFLGSVFS
jgi:capsular polysaccharide biosynthesis protein